LKHATGAETYNDKRVAPPAGAWIETPLLTLNASAA